MSKITEYEAASTFDANDVLLKDGENGTMIISVENAAQEFKRLVGIDDDISDINRSVTQAMGTIASNIAGVETDYIASKDYAIGDLFIVSNVLYKATAAIAEEDVIDTEINCAIVNLGDEIGDIRSELSNKANVDGSYSTLTAGNAEQLVGTVFTEDDAAYTFRTSGGSADIGDREYDEIVGGSIVWNQLSQTNRDQGTIFASSMNFVIENGVARIWGTLGGNDSGDFRLGNSNIPIPANHVLFLDTGLTDNILACRIQGKNSGRQKNNAILKVATTDSAVCDIVIDVYGNIGDEIDITFKPQIFDLTQMFGSEIADYIYNLEQTTPGAGVAWFRKYFPKDYYEYNAGELMHVSDLQSHDMVGFNIVSEPAHVGGHWSTNGNYNDTVQANYASFGDNKWPVVPGMTYCFSVPNIAYQTGIYVATFDKAGNHLTRKSPNRVSATTSKIVYTMPDGVYYIGVYFNRSGNGFTEAELKDICINLSWDGERDGEYEPYVKHSYPLDSSLTLRGIPKLSTDGKLYYDGDHYKSDGTVERRYGIVDLGTLGWSTGFGGFFSNGLKIPTNGDAKKVIVCERYTVIRNQGDTRDFSDKAITVIYAADPDYPQNGFLNVKDSSYTDAATFKEAMSGVYLVYELAEPTTEEAQPFQSPQIVDDFGTEEYVTSSIVPVGHITQYDSNLRAKLEMAPNSPDGDGDYLVRQTGGQNEYVSYTDGGRITALESKIPAAPSENGSYILKCTVTDGTATYAWVTE